MTPSRADKRFIRTSAGEIAYLEAGPPDAPPVLLVHGIPTSSFLWRHVMAHLPGLRCIAPDLMGLGDTRVDPARTDFAMPAQALMLDELLGALGIERAHLVAHDQGGAAAQILATLRPGRVDRMVLTNCVCFDNWPVPVIRQLQLFTRLPVLPDLLGRSGALAWVEKTRLGRFRRGVSDPTRLSPDAIDEYLRPLRGTPEERERFRRFLQAGSPRYTMNVVPLLRELRIPTLVLWAAEDRYLPVAWAQKLYETIPGARLAIVPGAGHFWPEEQPAELARHIGDFLCEKPPAKEEAPAPAVVPPERLVQKRCAQPAPKRARKQVNK